MGRKRANWDENGKRARSLPLRKGRAGYGPGNRSCLIKEMDLNIIILLKYFEDKIIKVLFNTHVQTSPSVIPSPILYLFIIRNMGISTCGYLKKNPHHALILSPIEIENNVR